MERQPNTIYIASISYGKDSLAMLEAIKRLGYPLDGIITAQVWATQEIPADLPEMYAWKGYADKIIKERYGLEVQKVYAQKDGKKVSYEDIFYRMRTPRKIGGGETIRLPFTTRLLGDINAQSPTTKQVQKQFTDTQCKRDNGATVFSKQVRYGFPSTIGAWCNSKLKVDCQCVFE